ncbi:MAG: YjfB family protein [Selenomonadaceae bacterium]|nr:YjfB family protein [Selenomonadaceae bacterium]MBR1858096.1 YjfB family protein [Selenomonadaceae bacterium]
MDMSIAAMSVGMHQAELWQNIGIEVLKKAMDADTEMIEEALDIGSLDPALGNNVDISV